MKTENFFDRELRAIRDALNTLQSTGAPLSQAAIDLYTMIDKKEKAAFYDKMSAYSSSMKKSIRDYETGAPMADHEINKFFQELIDSDFPMLDRLNPHYKLMASILISERRCTPKVKEKR